MIVQERLKWLMIQNWFVAIAKDEAWKDSKFRMAGSVHNTSYRIILLS